MTRRSPDDLGNDLERWVAAGLLARGQADAIIAHESAAAASEGGISVLAEALGYAGSALALAGIAAAFGQSWDSMASATRLAAVAIPTVLLVAGGWILHSKTEPAFRRLMSLLWFLAIGGFAAVAGVVLAEFADIDEDGVALVLGVAMLVPAFILWVLRPAVLQQMAVLGAALVTIVGVFMVFQGEPNGIALSVVTWALGAMWVALGWRGLIEPKVAAMVLGALLAAYAPVSGAESHQWWMFLGIATGAALMALSVRSKVVALLAIGTVAVFGYVTGIVLHYFRHQLGVPLALVIIGAVFIGLALLAARLGRLGRIGVSHT